ncbi:MAG TPA: hypothetical protein VHY82_05810 [Acetobacteraceae bacterium]|jgi:hypothetical protein|nr:hypothetical protein [Acetobacteraceae bacterium]
MPHMPGSAAIVAACLAAVVFAASAIPHLTSMLDRLRFTWTGLRSMDRPSVVVRTAAICESDAYAPISLLVVCPCDVNKKQPFLPEFDEKNV